MRLLFAAAALLLVLAGQASAQTRTLIEINGWRVTVSPSATGPICSMGTDANTLGRAFWMRVERLRGDLHGYVHISDRAWNVPRQSRGNLALFIDRRRADLSWTGTSNQTRIEASYLNAWRNFLNFAEAFAGGSTLRITFPGSQLEPWNADLRGTRRVTNVFLDCIRSM
jgi:hypothetical protein